MTKRKEVEIRILKHAIIETLFTSSTDGPHEAINLLQSCADDHLNADDFQDFAEEYVKTNTSTLEERKKENVEETIRFIKDFFTILDEKKLRKKLKL